MNQPPPIVRSSGSTPKRVYIYSTMLFLLGLLYLFGYINSSGSDSPIIRNLAPLRLVIFILCSACFGAAGVLLLKRKPLGRLLVIVGLLAHFSYILYFNIQLVTKDSSSSGVPLVGMIIGMATFLLVFCLFGAIPFTPKFSTYLGKSKSQPER